MGAFRDLAGQTFGRLSVLSRAENNKHGQLRWLCRCDCGTMKVVQGGSLASGNTTSCGCYSRDRASELNLNDLTGKTFGRLTVISRSDNDKRGNARWLCQCECGTMKVVQGIGLTRGTTTSCGCYHSEQVSERNRERLNDLAGQVFGRLTVICRSGNSKQGRPRWVCRCACGAEKIVASHSLASGNTTSCGCYSLERASVRRLNDLTGRVFGRLTVVSRAENSKTGQPRWLCQCECGGVTVVHGGSLASGKTTSCGCLVKENPGGYNRTRLERGDFLESDTTSFLYVMQVGALVKVGVSNNPTERASKIRRRSKLPVEVLATYKGSLHDVVSWEIASHEALAKHKTSSHTHFSGHTELFSAPLEYIKQTVENICKQ